MNAPTPYTTSQISIFDVDFSSSYLNVLLQGNKWGGPLGSAATVYYSFPTSRSDAYWSQDFINGYGIFDPTTDGTPDYVSLTPLTSNQQNGITLALNAWASVANLDFIKVDETPSAVGDIRFGFTQDGAMAPDIYAYSYNVDPTLYDYSDIFPYTRGGDIWFNKNQPDQTGNNFATGAMGYFVGLHEIGHSLGLDHSFSEEDRDLGLQTNIEYIQYTVMSYSDLPGSHFDGFNEYYPTTPMLYDILAIQHLYGANNSYNADDTVYEFSSSQRYYQTIWDAGGNDTIKYASSIGGVINLEEGSFSQLGKAFKVGVNNNTIQKDNIAIAFNVVIENAIGGSGSDKITGNSADNRLEGAAGDDTLDGGMGADTLIGGKGNDTYIVDNINDVITELANEGTDLVKTSVTYTLSVHVENLTLTGAEGIDGIGNNTNNIITGNDANNSLNGNEGSDTLNGAAGDDILDGGAGVDKLIGGNGDDTYIVDLVRTGTTAANYKIALQDTITETAVAGSGTDTVILRGGSTDPATFTTITLGANLENLDTSDTGSTKLNLTGNALANTLTGNSADNILNGGAGVDSLIGGVGNDTLNGGAGVDTLYGGTGNDTYMLELKLQGSGAGAFVMVEDTVAEFNGLNDGIDMIKLSGSANLTNATTFALDGQWANAEVLDASATGSTKLHLIANNRGSTLIGNAAANTLNGGAGSDTLNGGAGADRMIGGDGDDTYIIDNMADQVIEQSNIPSMVSQPSSGNSNSASLSDDGQYLVFSSNRYFLPDEDDSANVYALNLQTNVIEKLSASVSSLGASHSPSISADGRFVAFQHSNEGILVKDLLTGSLENLGVMPQGTPADTYSAPKISADGRYVLFKTTESVISGDNNATNDIYVKDLHTGAFILISSDANGNNSSNPSAQASFSADSQFVVFSSDAALVANHTTNATGIYVKNIQTGAIQLINTTATGEPADNYSFSAYASFSSDGRFVLFSSNAHNLVAGSSLNGFQLYIKDTLTGAIERVDDASGNQFLGYRGAFSPDGTKIVFESQSSTLVAGDMNNQRDIFVKDLITGEVQRVNTSATGAESTAFGDNGGWSYEAKFSPDGKSIIFASYADDLTSGNAVFGYQDIFIKHLETGEIKQYPGTVTTLEQHSGVDLVKASVSYTLSDNVENLELTGTAAINGTGNDLNNVIIGNTGNNILDGGAGADRLEGSKGNDTYIVNHADDTVVEEDKAGTDHVKANVSYTLSDYVENLTLTGMDHINGTGNALANTITGNTGNNILNGGAGTDSLTGGQGNDTYLVDLKLSGTGANVTGAMEDSIKELANQGTDTVVLRGGSGITKASTIVLGANLENLDASETGAALLNLTGNALINELTGNNVANVLDGGAGADTLKGGAGDDIYLVDLIKLDSTTAGLQDTITEVSNAGNDTIKLRGSVVLTANATLILDSNLENMDASLTGKSRLNLVGNGQSNVLTGNAAANLLDGASGDDTLLGGAGNDTLLGGMGNDWLDGGAGNDSLDGGDGDDTYIVDNIADAVTEEINGGTDLIKTSITYSLTLANNVENLELTGTAAINGTGNDDANIITGNAGNNILDGKSGIDTLRGGKGNDTYIVNDENDVVEEDPNAGIDLVKASSNFMLSNNVENLTLTDGSANGGTTPLEGTGNALANTITGNAGNNILDGGAGVDKLIGGAGDDTYIVDLQVKDRFSGKTFIGSYLALEDTITEAKNAGNDTLVLRGNAPGGYSITLVDNVENLDAQSVIRIAGPSSAGINLYGNALDNRIWGNNDGNSISGGAGNDTLFGGDGEDTLDGGEGVNTMAGGKGGDTYIIRNSNDVIYESPDDNGVDHIFTFVSINLDLFPGIEYAEVYYGAQNVVISSSAGNIYGGSDGNDQLIGSDGNDTFLSSAGKNTLTGGLGNDTYHVNGTGNTINELSNQGTDLVNASISYSLGNNLENLTLTGTAGINGTGNDLNNVITGNTANNVLSGGIGNDSLIGGGGNDTLTGGIGADVFKWVFSDSWYPNSTDTITDFSTMQGDALDLRDFLLGETQSNLQDYLNIVAQDGNTEITISYNGQLNNVSNENAHLVLTNTDLYALTGQSTQSELIGYLIIIKL